MLILGLDPGLHHTGWGVIRSLDNRLSYVASGCIKTKTDKQDEMGGIAARLVDIYHQLQAVMDGFEIVEAAVEETFVNSNGMTTLKLGQARAMSLLVPALRGLPVYEYAATLIKKSVVGAGHADKNQVMHMIKILLPQSNCQTDHEADALAVAVCHAHHRTLSGLIQTPQKVKQI